MSRRLGLWSLVLALPVVALVLLAAEPDLDLRWEHHRSHFWLVLTVALAWAAWAVWPPAPEARWSLPADEAANTLFTPDGQTDRIGTFFNGSFACDNVERTYEELKAKGVEFSGPPKKETWGTFTTFKDPDGNQFVIGSR